MTVARDQRTGQPLMVTDPKWREAAYNKRVAFEQARAAEVPAAFNARDVELLNRAQAAVNPNSGKRYFREDQQTRERVENMRAAVYSGQPIPADVRSATESRLRELHGI